MPVATNPLAEALRNLGTVAFGVILMLTPLALWVAWTKTVFVVVLMLGAVAGALCCVLAADPGSVLEDRRERSRPESTPTLPDEFVAGLHELFPLTYHHRRIGDPFFQRKMDRLKKLLNR
jgi:hypothetical protein